MEDYGIRAIEFLPLPSVAARVSFHQLNSLKSVFFFKPTLSSERPTMASTYGFLTSERRTEVTRAFNPFFISINPNYHFFYFTTKYIGYFCSITSWHGCRSSIALLCAYGSRRFFFSPTFLRPVLALSQLLCGSRLSPVRGVEFIPPCYFFCISG